MTRTLTTLAAAATLVALSLGSRPAAAADEDDCENPAYGETCENSDAAKRAGDEPMEVRGVSVKQQSGVRVGYAYVNGAEAHGFSPHMFVMGLELNQVYGQPGPMNFLVIGNIMTLGLNQAILIPSVNGIVGVELGGKLQAGVGINLSVGEYPLHMIAAAGSNFEVGEFTVPLHFSVVPDPDGNVRVAATTGVNF